MQIQRFSRLATLALPIALLLLASVPASATPAWSWNLSRDRLTGINQNPVGAWSFVAAIPASSPIWAPLANTTSTCFGNIGFDCWWEPSNALVGHAMTTGTVAGLPMVHGVPLLHPGNGKYVAVRWKNDTNQLIDVRILGRVTDLDSNSGNWFTGISFSVVRGVVPLFSGAVKSTSSSNLQSQTFYVTATSVAANEEIYFIVDPMSDYNYDLTELDVLITGTPHCAIPNCSPE